MTPESPRSAPSALAWTALLGAAGSLSAQTAAPAAKPVPKK